MSEFKLMLYIFLGFVVLIFICYGGVGATIDLFKKIFKKEKPRNINDDIVVTYTPINITPRTADEEPYIIWIDAGNGLLKKKIPTCPNCGGELMKKRYSDEVTCHYCGEVFKKERKLCEMD